MRMIAYCGLDCSVCPARTAYLNDDDELRRKTAVEWSHLYGTDIKPEAVNCTGCKEEGVKFPHCEQGCGIRKCALPRGIANCGECTEYPCGRINSFFEFVPEAKANLES